MKPNLKKILRWLILGAVFAFLLKTLLVNWREVAQIQIDAIGWACIAIAIGVTLLGHVCTGYVWGLILRSLAQSISPVWAIQTYLKTNLAKYLPGNVWHFYGRVNAAKKEGVPLAVATLSIILEPLLLVAAACLLGVLGLPGKFYSAAPIVQTTLQGLILVITLAIVHPRILNPLLQRASRLKLKASDQPMGESLTLTIDRYPIVPLFGEIGFLGLRSFGFLLTFLAIAPFNLQDVPLLVGTFAWAWLLGFVVPGLPGGIGVFEATAIALLHSHFPAATVLSIVAVYRLVNTIAEALGAGLAAIDERIAR